MGYFITFEGIEGCGKSTQTDLLKGHFREKGERVLFLREPGGTPLGERVREILLGSQEPIEPFAELFLYEACRAQLVKTVIAPALRGGITVICDRFTDSTLAYQGYARGLDIEAVKEANRLACQGITPDLTILIDCPAGLGLKRAWDRINAAEGAREDRFEKESLGFHEKVRQGYLEIAKDEPRRVRVLDGTMDISSIQGKIRDIIDKSM